MDYVYICRSGKNEELRYSIRSVMSNTRDSNIWIVGGKPDWYSGNFISVDDLDGNKFKNIQNCLSIICSTVEISETFVLMNDDFFITKQIEEFDNYYDGFLSDRIDAYRDIFGRNQYLSILIDTHNKLERSGIQKPLNYEIHTPIKINKNNMKSVVNVSLAPRSFYGNIFNIGGQEIKDNKVYPNTEKIIDNGFLSTQDDSFIKIQRRLQELFPEPSKYEKI